MQNLTVIDSQELRQIKQDLAYLKQLLMEARQYHYQDGGTQYMHIAFVPYKYTEMKNTVKNLMAKLCR